MAIVKFITSGCPMNNIFAYVMRGEATEAKLISGVACSPDTALEEFQFVKRQFGKEDGRMYYHIVQAFSPDDPITAEMAHEIGLKFAAYFPDYQIVVATHYNTDHVHNHLIMNSVNIRSGKKFHQTRDEMLDVKTFSNKLCAEYGLTVTEEKCSYDDIPAWKKRLVQTALRAMEETYTKDAFIDYMRMHGYRVRWDDDHKYITFTTPEGYRARDNKLFDERLLKENMELYYAMGGTDTRFAEVYQTYETPPHKPTATMTTSVGLIALLGQMLSSTPPDYDPQMIVEMNPWERQQLEKLLGRKISPKAAAHYSERQNYNQSMDWVW